METAEKTHRLNTVNDSNTVVRIGRIRYINTDPVYYGFDRHGLPRGVRMISRPPAELNRMMAAGGLDVSPVSSAAYAENFKDWLILPNLSVSCFGKVMSVILVSRHPFQQLDGKTVLLTDDSAAAADLVRLIFALSRIRPVFKKGKIKSPLDLMESAQAALVIGDAALAYDWEGWFPYVWDLGGMWHDMTGLPFVFALWTVRRSFAEQYPETASWVLDLLYASKHEGLTHMGSIVDKSAERVGISRQRCRRYYSHLEYRLKAPQYRGLIAFFEGLHAVGLIAQKPEICFFKPPAQRSAAGG